jgi:hypothetical protein
MAGEEKTKLRLEIAHVLNTRLAVCFRFVTIDSAKRRRVA